MRYERYGREVEDTADLREMYKLEAKHLLQEEKWAEVTDRIVALAQIRR
ncbi:hypothetical protein I2I11_14310 [Pontibacter sp. 172403-2]|nr:hypothetical protein [Pontibacter sp. 172403-2]MBF9254473.1 hypothetical protein [Pontibacter sp. 172403-2]